MFDIRGAESTARAGPTKRYAVKIVNHQRQRFALLFDLSPSHQLSERLLGARSDAEHQNPECSCRFDVSSVQRVGMLFLWLRLILFSLLASNHLKYSLKLQLFFRMRVNGCQG